MLYISFVLKIKHRRRFQSVFISVTFTVNCVKFRTFILNEGCTHSCSNKGAALTNKKYGEKISKFKYIRFLALLFDKNKSELIKCSRPSISERSWVTLQYDWKRLGIALQHKYSHKNQKRDTVCQLASKNDNKRWDLKNFMFRSFIECLQFRSNMMH